MTNLEFDHYPIELYSNFIMWLQRLNMRSAPPSQWLATINSAKGIRAEEIVRSDLLNFIVESKNTQKITKAQLVEVAELALSKCRLSIQTQLATAYRPSSHLKKFTPEDIPKRIINTFSNGEIINCVKLTSFNYRIIGLRFNTSLFGIIDSWFVFDNRWRQFKPFRCYKTAVESIDFLYSAAIAKFNQHRSHAPHNHYEGYSLLGANRNYKEWIVSIPNWTGLFNDAHFDVQNTILHLRTSEWKDVDGKSLFLVDEIQSDWHAKGRDNGYYDTNYSTDEDKTDSVPDAPYIKEWHELGIKIAIWVSLLSGHNQVAFTVANVHSERYGNDLDGFHMLYDQLIPKALRKIAAKFECNLTMLTIKTKMPNHMLLNRGADGWDLVPSIKGEIKAVVRNEEVAMRIMQSRATERMREVLVLEISGSLANTVKNKGLPMFGWW